MVEVGPRAPPRPHAHARTHVCLGLVSIRSTRTCRALQITAVRANHWRVLGGDPAGQDEARRPRACHHTHACARVSPCLGAHSCTHVRLQVVIPLDKKKPDAEAASLVEVGPRACLNPIKIFDGSFGGRTLYENPSYVSPNAVSAG